MPQLNGDFIVRNQNVRTWPEPVWGTHLAVPYSESALVEVKEKLLVAIAGQCGFSQAG